MNKGILVHLKNKYPHCHVSVSDSSLRVSDDKGLRVIATRQANGSFECQKHNFGAEYRLDMSPIPKEARLFKLYSDGRVGKSEEYDDRKKFSDELIEKYDFIPSIVELELKK